MPEVQMYGDDGKLTLDGMKAQHAQGNSILWSNAAGKPILIRPGEQLPSEADMAKGKPAQEEAVRQALQAEISRLTQQLTSLGQETTVSYAVGNEQATGSLPGLTAIHPDMVGAFPPQKGPDAQPLKPEEIPAEARVLNVSEQPVAASEQPVGEQPAGEPKASEDPAAPAPPEGEFPIPAWAEVDGDSQDKPETKGKGRKP